MIFIRSRYRMEFSYEFSYKFVARSSTFKYHALFRRVLLYILEQFYLHNMVFFLRLWTNIGILCLTWNKKKRNISKLKHIFSIFRFNILIRNNMLIIFLTLIWICRTICYNNISDILSEIHFLWLVSSFQNLSLIVTSMITRELKILFIIIVFPLFNHRSIEVSVT